MPMGYNPTIPNARYGSGGTGDIDSMLLDPAQSKQYNLKPVNFNVDPSLDPTKLMDYQKQGIDALNQPLTDTVSGLIAPQLDILRRDVGEKTAQDKASAQSDLMRRGLTGSSTEVGTIMRDIPAEGQKALATGEANLISGALPVAQAHQAAIATAFNNMAQTGISLRNMVTDEQYKGLSLEQKDRLAAADADLQKRLKLTDMKYQTALEQAKEAFQAAENDKDRAVAQQQFEYLQKLKKQEGFGHMLSAFGAVGGFMAGGPVGGVLGEGIGSGLGSMLSL